MDELDDNESLPIVEMGIDYAFTCMAALCIVLDNSKTTNEVGYQRAKAAYNHLLEKINVHDFEILVDVLHRQRLEKEAFELMNPPNETVNTVNTVNNINYYITHT